jgi:hypothetical protein
VPQGVMDVKRRFTKIFIGLLGSINDFWAFESMDCIKRST